MAKNISYKAKIAESGETRRFTVDEESRASFAKFQDKLKQIFPQLNTKNFQITWKDLDGDNILISSDEELLIAIGDMTEPVFNIGFKEDRKKAPSGNINCGQIHPGIVCDGCDGSVIGIRFKCLVCNDFDLCSVCEAKGIHPVHDMLQITSPFDGHFFLFGNPHRRQYGRIKRKMCMPRMRDSRRPNGCWIGSTLNLDECMGATEKNVIEADKKAANKYMTKIGEVINAVLGALLTDDNTEPESSKTANNNDKPAEKTKETEGQAKPTEHIEQASKTSELTSNMYPALPKSLDTIVENRDSPVEVNGAPIAPTSMHQGESDPEDNAIALEPRVQVARQAMLNMGFNDDGGWLTTLIKAKNGDIVEVLGELQTDKKQ